MLTFTTGLLIDILHHIDPAMAADFEIDPQDLETIAETLNEDSDIQDSISNLMD